MDVNENESSSSKRPTEFCGLQIDGLSSDGCVSAKEDRYKKRMKKDDSGINVIEGSGDSDDNDSNQNNETELDGCDKLENGKQLEPSSPDSGNLEFSNLSTESNDQDQKLATSAKERRKEEDRAKSDSDSEDDYDIEALNKLKGNIKFDPTPKTPRPKHNWNALRVVTNRQYGSGLNYSPDLFRYNCYGSLHMVERLELMYKMRKHDGCVNTLHFNSYGTKLATGSDDLDIIIWDWTLSEPKIEYRSGHKSNVFQAKFMPLSGDCHIVSCARDGQIRLGELSSSKAHSTKKLAQHKGAAHKLAIQLDSPHTFLSCGEDAVVFELDLRKEKPEKLVICKENEKKVPLYSICNNPIKSYECVVGGRDHFVRVYDSRFINQGEGFLKKYCPQHLVGNDRIKANVTSVVYNYNGQDILSSYNDEDIYTFASNETDTSKYLHRYRGHRNSQTVKGVNYFGSKSEYIVSGSDCGYIFFWEKESEHIVKYMYGDEGGVVNCLEPNPNMPVLATSGLDDDIKIWVPSCEELPNLTNLREHICANMKEREDDRRLSCPDAFDEQMMWFLMQHLRRSRRRNQAANDATASSNTSTSESDSDSDAPEQPQEPGLELQSRVQCNQS